MITLSCRCGFCSACVARQHDAAASTFTAGMDVTARTRGRFESATVVAPRLDGSGLVDVRVMRRVIAVMHWALTPVPTRTAERVTPLLTAGAGR